MAENLSNSPDALFQFEEVHGSLAQVAAVLAAAGEEVAQGGMSQRGVLMMYAAENVLQHAIQKMSDAIHVSSRSFGAAVEPRHFRPQFHSTNAG